jgi:hypothetical protein
MVIHLTAIGGNRPSDIRRASLAANRWIAGTTFSIADIPLAYLLALAEHMDTLSGSGDHRSC